MATQQANRQIRTTPEADKGIIKIRQLLLESGKSATITEAVNKAIIYCAKHATKEEL